MTAMSAVLRRSPLRSDASLAPVGVSVHVRSERGENLLSLEDAASTVPAPTPPASCKRLVPLGADDAYRMLGGIDPHANICFNGLQAERLAQELDGLERTVSSGEARSPSRSHRCAEETSAPLLVVHR